MKAKFSVVLFFFIFANGTVFAQEETRIEPSPKNVITLDVGKIAYSLLISSAINTDTEYPSAFITAAAQYERHLSEDWSLAGRLSYSQLSSFRDELHILSGSIEGHVRYYPDRGWFYVDGMLGYANFLKTGDISTTPMSHYFLVGGNIGMRIDFDEPGGFIFEPSLGYAASFGNGLNGMDDVLVKVFFIGMGSRFTISFGYRF